MKRFDPSFLYMFGGSNLHGRQRLELGGADPNTPISEEVYETAISLYGLAQEQCNCYGLRASAMTAAKLLDAAKRRATRKEVAELLEEFSNRVADELSCELFLQLSISEAQQYENWNKGWEDLLVVFPDITRDVEEMNKCAAVARYTAAMFHALHVAEWGAILLGNKIGVTDPKKGWGPTDKKLRELIKAGRSSFNPALGVTFEFLEQMHREINSMMLAWRHKVDHAANTLAILPNTDFTPDVAAHVIGAVRIFMIRLTEGLP